MPQSLKIQLTPPIVVQTRCTSSRYLNTAITWLHSLSLENLATYISHRVTTSYVYANPIKLPQCYKMVLNLFVWFVTGFDIPREQSIANNNKSKILKEILWETNRYLSVPLLPV